MKTIKININGKETEITLTKEQLKQIENQNPMQKVYDYHNTTEEEFDRLYKNVSEFAKAQEIERMIVNFYNKGEQPDWNNSNQYKYYPYFYLGSNFSYDYYYAWYSYSSVSARLCFLRKEDLLEAVVVHKEQYENSRNK
jgi:hypothetical protein